MAKISKTFKDSGLIVIDNRQKIHELSLFKEITNSIVKRIYQFFYCIVIVLDKNEYSSHDSSPGRVLSCELMTYKKPMETVLCKHE